MAFDFSKIVSILKQTNAAASANSVVGIDIGTASVKVVELERSDNAIALKTYGEIQLGPYADLELSQTTALSEQQLTQALNDVLKAADVSADIGILAMSYASSFMTVIRVSAPSETELEARIRVEARKYIPVPVKEVTLNWFSINSTTHENTIEEQVLLAAVHNETLGRYRSVLSGAGKATASLEIEVFSAVRAALTPEDTVTAVVDIGAATAKIYIVEAGTVRQMYSTKLAGTALTEAISKAQNLPFAEAEIAKRTHGLLESDDTSAPRDAMDPVMSRMTRELQQVMKRYESEHTTTVNAVVLTGGGAAMPGLQAHCSDVWQRPVRVVDPFAKVAYPNFMEDVLVTAGPSFAVAIGAALRLLTEGE